MKIRFEATPATCAIGLSWSRFWIFRSVSIHLPFFRIVLRFVARHRPMAAASSATFTLSAAVGRPADLTDFKARSAATKEQR